MDQIVFIVDLNEIENENFVPISMDFTVNYGPFVRRVDHQPKVGDYVCIHSDDDNTLYHARVVEQRSDRDLLVEIDWSTCQPVLNSLWSAQDWPGYTLSKTSVTEADDLAPNYS